MAICCNDRVADVLNTDDKWNEIDSETNPQVAPLAVHKQRLFIYKSRFHF
jgi:hypothetical protein